MEMALNRPVLLISAHKSGLVPAGGTYVMTVVCL